MLRRSARWRAAAIRTVPLSAVKAAALRNLALAASGDAGGDGDAAGASPRIIIVDVRSKDEILRSRAEAAAQAKKQQQQQSGTAVAAVGVASGMVPTAVHVPFPALEAHLALSMDMQEEEAELEERRRRNGGHVEHSARAGTLDAALISAQVPGSLAPPPPFMPDKHQLLFYCASGVRSAYAISVAAGFGFRGLSHFPDGYGAYAADPITANDLAAFTREWNAAAPPVND